ncbi:unnamed protein product, partial [Ixodes hexagonus]
MAAAVMNCLRTALLGALVAQLYATQIGHRKFEYKYSFKGPYLAQKDGSVPFWEYGGNCIASEEMVRITPSLKSKKGSIWSKQPTSFPWWEVELVFRTTGTGRIGADGLAFWYTDRKQAEGPVFGSSDKWNGLAIFFDSFDNDNKHNNPYIMGMVNDGTKAYDHESDGANQQLAGCQRDFRNKPYPVRAKIEYFNNILTVLFHNGNTNNDGDYEMCFRAENVFLPTSGHFGVSAATGGLAGELLLSERDDHDALKFLTTSLYAEGTQPVMAQGMADAEKEKFSKEYDQYKDKLEKQKEEYRKLHPEEAAKQAMEHGPEQAYDTQQQRELRQIFEGQSHMFEGLKALHRKLDEVLGRQERTLSLVSAAGGGVAVGGGGMPPPHMGQGGVPSLQRHEAESLLNSQRELLQTVAQVKSFVAEVHQRTANLHQQGGAAQGLTADQLQVLHQVRDSVASMHRDVSNNQPQRTGCATACLSTTHFLLFATLQLAVTLGYLVYR